MSQDQILHESAGLIPLVPEPSVHMQALVFYLLVWVFKENEQLYIT